MTSCRDLEGEKGTLAAAVAARDGKLAGAHCQVAELQQKLEAAQAEAAALLSAAGRRGEELMRQHREAAAKTTALGDYGVNLHRHAAATWHGTANCQCRRPQAGSFLQSKIHVPSEVTTLDER